MAIRTRSYFMIPLSLILYPHLYLLSIVCLFISMLFMLFVAPCSPITICSSFHPSTPIRHVLVPVTNFSATFTTFTHSSHFVSFPSTLNAHCHIICTQRHYALIFVLGLIPPSFSHPPHSSAILGLSCWAVRHCCSFRPAAWWAVLELFRHTRLKSLSRFNPFEPRFAP
jgi:hypothetical protein